MVDVEVLSGHIIVGKGYVYLCGDDLVSTPDITSFDGKPLPSDWYTLRYTGNSRLVVASRTVQ